MIKKTDSAVGLTAAAHAKGIMVAIRFGSGIVLTPYILIFYNTHIISFSR